MPAKTRSAASGGFPRLVFHCRSDTVSGLPGFPRQREARRRRPPSAVSPGLTRAKHPLPRAARQPNTKSPPSVRDDGLVLGGQDEPTDRQVSTHIQRELPCFAEVPKDSSGRVVTVGSHFVRQQAALGAIRTTPEEGAMPSSHLTASDLGKIQRVLAAAHPTTGALGIGHEAARFLMRKFEEGMTDEAALAEAFDQYIAKRNGWRRVHGGLDGKRAH